MKRFMCGVFSVLMVLFLNGVNVAQVSNFLVDGVKNGAVSRQGEVVTWEYSLSVGGTAMVEIWVDVDSNSVLDTLDFRLYGFDQLDGAESNEGPPDMDGTTNGKVYVQLPHGLAPAHYFMIATENNVADSVDFHVLPLLNPAFSIFGEVLDRQGNGLPWIPIEANAEDEQTMPNFWNAFTDSSGNFVIYFDSSAVQNNQPWNVEINRDAVQNYIITGKDTSLSLSGNHGPIAFQLLKPAMYISGTILDELGNPLQYLVGAWAWHELKKANRNTQVEPSGQFTIAFAEEDTGKWQVGVWSEKFSHQYLEPLPHQIILAETGDSLVTNFTVYATDDTIWGQLIVDENLSVGSREIMASDLLVGMSRDTTDFSGFFAIPVSSQAQQYEIRVGWQAMDEFMKNGLQLNNGQPVFAAAGDTIKLKFEKQMTKQIVVTGSVKDETGATILFPIEVWAQQSNNFFQKHAPINPNGNFEFFFAEHERGIWDFGIINQNWNLQFLFPHPEQLDLFQVGDSAHVEFIVYNADDSIWGKILGLDSSLFQNQIIFAGNEITGSNLAHVDSLGKFVIPVSSVGTEYKIRLEDSLYQQIVDAGFYLQTPQPIHAEPGDTISMQFSNSPISLGNLLINGQKSGSQFQQGAELQWSYQVPVGAMANLELWVDQNNDSSLTQNDDLLLFPFSQVDGEFMRDGPPDMDGLVNGSVFVQMPLGLAPARYFFRVYDLTHADTAEFKILPIPQPQQTIFGQVLDEIGGGMPWVLVQAEVNKGEGMPDFRYSFTDSSGNYLIAMDGIVQSPQQEWRLNLFEGTLNNQIPLENEYLLNISGNHGPFDFHVVQPKMFVHGKITDENGKPVFNQLTPYAWNEKQHIDRSSRMIDSTGSFYLYFSDQDTGSWDVGIYFDENNSNFMNPNRTQINLAQEGDTAEVAFTVYHTDAFIYGKVFADGEPIVANRRVAAENDTAGFSEVITGPDGYFSIPVSSTMQSYIVKLEWDEFEQFRQAGFQLISADPMIASPGDSVVIQFSSNISGISQKLKLPLSFSLNQNYPNPLSLQHQQIATIVFSVPTEAAVQISVFNLLGQKVAELINDQMSTGKHVVHWSGNNQKGQKLSAGVYFIQMTAPNFVQNRKLLIVR